MMKWTKCAIRFLRISRPGVRVPSIAPKNAVKSKDFMAFLFCKPWLHGFCTVFARSVFSMSDDVGRCIALQSVPFLHQVSSARRSFAFISGSASFALLVLGQCADPLDHGVLQKLLLIYSIPRACYTKTSTLFTHRFCETVVF